ncbi:MAG TPA: hypothetical protein VFN90_02970 [Gemmatimonadales bacterium]|nr:hypothetical protein [Gemmatimonadales bacterium]
MVKELLAWGGIGGQPVEAGELAARRPQVERRVALLEAHLAHVEATAPADAEPHRRALALARGELAWLDTRQAEEVRHAEWSKANPPGIGREISQLIGYFTGR